MKTVDEAEFKMMKNIQELTHKSKNTYEMEIL